MRILMCSMPGGDRGPAVGYRNHCESLRRAGDDVIDLFDVIRSGIHVEDVDVLWFYVRFDPAIFHALRCQFPRAKVVVGPNALFERGHEGPSDDWERWFIQSCTCDCYVNVAKYYLDHVTGFYSGYGSALELPYCVDGAKIAVSSLDDKKFDVLLYLKQRVNDDSVIDIEFGLIESFIREGITFKVLVYGSHERDDYIRALSEARVCVWLAIEDYCSLAQIEAMYSGVHVIGSMYNVTHPCSGMPTAERSQRFDRWVTWSNDAVEDILSATQRSIACADPLAVRSHAERSFSLETYAQNVHAMLAVS